jgi:ATP-dependent Zn protease
MVADIQVSLASRVAEQLFFGQTSNGHGGDGPHATAVAEQMVRLGHGSTIGFYGPDRRPKGEWQAEVEAILRDALTLTEELLEPRQNQIDAVAQLLESDGSVPGDQIHSLLAEMEAQRVGV